MIPSSRCSVLTYCPSFFPLRKRFIQDGSHRAGRKLPPTSAEPYTLANFNSRGHLVESRLIFTPRSFLQQRARDAIAGLRTAGRLQQMLDF
jgi:hypothetical protein